MIDYAIILQARMGSNRTPGKVAAIMAGNEMLYHQIQRLLKNGLKNIIIATSVNCLDEKVIDIAAKCNVTTFRGSENDVLERYYHAARLNGIKNIIRLCGDDPLIDPECIKALIETHKKNPANFITASHRNGWVYGTTAELIEFNCLEKTYNTAETKSDREHVNPFIKRNEDFSKTRISPSNELERRPEIYLSVDYPKDLALVKQIIEYFDGLKKTHTFTQMELIELYDSGKLNIQNLHLHAGFND
jgi:spore coat polysaccharide biosynthesis protein SpsF